MILSDVDLTMEEGRIYGFLLAIIVLRWYIFVLECACRVLSRMAEFMREHDAIYRKEVSLWKRLWTRLWHWQKQEDLFIRVQKYTADLRIHGITVT